MCVCTLPLFQFILAVAPYEDIQACPDDPFIFPIYGDAKEVPEDPEPFNSWTFIVGWVDSPKEILPPLISTAFK